MRRKMSPKFHVKNGAKNGKFHAKFTLLGRSADRTSSAFFSEPCHDCCIHSALMKLLSEHSQSHSNAFRYTVHSIFDGPAIRNANRGDTHESICRNFSICMTFERCARIASNLRFAILGACTITTFLDNQICNFKFLLSWRFQRKQRVFERFSSLPPMPPKTHILFLLSPRCLRHSI